jgi:hypothetical protein
VGGDSDNQKIKKLRAEVSAQRDQISQLSKSASTTKRELEGARGELNRRNVVELERIAQKDIDQKRSLAAQQAEHVRKQQSAAGHYAAVDANLAAALRTLSVSERKMKLSVTRSEHDRALSESHREVAVCERKLAVATTCTANIRLQTELQDERAANLRAWEGDSNSDSEGEGGGEEGAIRAV